MTEQETPRSFTTYTPRRLSVFHQGYSLFVRILKLALPLVALLIVGLLVMRLTTRNFQQQDLASLPADQKTTPGQIELMHPKYEGVDDQGRPYTVTADKAARAVSAPDTVLFTNPVADITLADKTWAAAKALSGTFERKAEILELKDNVSVFHDSGYEVHTEALQINLKTKTAYAAQPVHAQGPMGTIAAQNMSVQNQGELVIFGGPATLTFFSLSPSAKKGRG